MPELTKLSASILTTTWAKLLGLLAVIGAIVGIYVEITGAVSATYDARMKADKAWGATTPLPDNFNAPVTSPFDQRPKK